MGVPVVQIAPNGPHSSVNRAGSPLISATTSSRFCTVPSETVPAELLHRFGSQVFLRVPTAHEGPCTLTGTV